MGRRSSRALVVSSTILVAAGLGFGATPAQSQAPESWLDIVNAYRGASGLGPVVNDPTLQPGVDAHARYTAASGVLQHFESPGPLFTPEGDKAGKQSVINAWTGPTFSDRQHLDAWLTAPFHAIHLFEPRLQRVAFASVNGQPGPFPSVGVLNILGGLGPKTPLGQPIVFPGNGSTTPLTTFEVEYPNPLTSCPGYSAPAGLPLIALFPKPISGATSTVRANGTDLEVCTIDNGFVNPDASAQNVGRTLLTQKNGVFVIPKAPLVPGTTYEVTIRGGDQTAAWSFTAAAVGSALPKATDPITQPATASAASTTIAATPSTVALAKAPSGKRTTTKRSKVTTKKAAKK